MSSDANQKGNVHHGVDYVEFGGSDLEATKSFYSSAFGWSFSDYGPAYVGFSDGARGELEAGGFHQADEPSSLVVIYSNDLEASLASVTGAGATIVKDIFEFPGGRRFEFRDPSGNCLAVWSKG